VVLLLGRRELPVILIRIKPEEMQTAMAFIQEKWNKYNLKFPYEPRFMTDVINEMYTDEIKLGRIFRTFAIITILISCLGLFGMSTFVTERRTKEIGIRKVIGASAQNIVYHLSKEFIGMVLIADVIAIPLAWFVAGKWLSNFPYRIDIQIYYFLIAVCVSILIALVTVSYQAAKAALTDPARTLKYE
jgi:putative ABC transport system permease protein